MLLEAVLGGLWAWWILGEVPAVNVLIGGLVVLVAVGLRAAAERFG